MFQRQFDGRFARQTRLHEDGVHPVLVHGRENRVELLRATDHENPDRNVQCSAAKLDLFDERPAERIGRIGQDRYTTRGRQHLANEF